jgi:hypothetical protein
MSSKRFIFPIVTQPILGKNPPRRKTQKPLATFQRLVSAIERLACMVLTQFKNSEFYIKCVKILVDN